MPIDAAWVVAEGEAAFRGSEVERRVMEMLAVP
jgi:hypothetical protein